jgi:hypothetical protein
MLLAYRRCSFEQYALPVLHRPTASSLKTKTRGRNGLNLNVESIRPASPSLKGRGHFNT